MNRIKAWIVKKYLPAYARAALEEENSWLRERVNELNNEVRVLEAHITGLQEGLRTIRRITISTGGGK